MTSQLQTTLSVVPLHRLAKERNLCARTLRRAIQMGYLRAEKHNLTPWPKGHPRTHWFISPDDLDRYLADCRRNTQASPGPEISPTSSGEGNAHRRNKGKTLFAVGSIIEAAERLCAEGRPTDRS